MIRPSDQSKPPLLTEEGLEKEGGFLPGQNIIDTVIPLLEDKAERSNAVYRALLSPNMKNQVPGLLTSTYGDVFSKDLDA